MKQNIMKLLGALVVAIALLGAIVPASQASLLSNAGKAVQYSTRKGAENLTANVHRGVHAKSVVRDRNTHGNYVLKPNGHKIFKSTTRHHHIHRYPKYMK